MPTIARQALVALAAICLLSAAKAPASHPPAPDRRVLAKLAEQKLATGSYEDSLENAYWASGQGPVIVPVLANMLSHEKALGAQGPASAFPFDAIWALGRIATPEALLALQKYQQGPHTHDASGAIHAAKLRIGTKDKEIGVTIRDDQALLASNDQKASILKTLHAGTPVRALAYRIDGPGGQTNPRGGPVHFDKVLVLPKGPLGYLERAGDDFATIY